MYAIIKAQGKQFKVQKGDIVLFDNLSKEPKEKIEFNEVLFISSDKSPKFGTPLVDGAKVSGEVVANGRGEKILVFKKRRRKDSKQRRGFRRDFTKVRITDIQG